MNRLEAYLQGMIQVTEGVSRNIIQKSNVLMRSTMDGQTYAKHSPIRVSSPYKVDKPHRAPEHRASLTSSISAVTKSFSNSS